MTYLNLLRCYMLSHAHLILSICISFLLLLYQITTNSLRPYHSEHTWSCQITTNFVAGNNTNVVAYTSIDQRSDLDHRPKVKVL